MTDYGIDSLCGVTDYDVVSLCGMTVSAARLTDYSNLNLFSSSLCFAKAFK